MLRAFSSLLLTSMLLVACEGDEPAPPRPLPADSPPEETEVPSAEEQAERIARNPQLLLFDLQTALESAESARGAYPTTAEFEADERWQLHRAALTAAFTEWSYESDGTTYRVEGTRGERRLSVESEAEGTP